MSKYYLIRHGQTDWNAQYLIQGSIDRPLNEEGRAQAEQLAERFSKESISAIFSSPLIRARKTAEIINRYHNHDIQIESDLREGTFGAAEGMSWPLFRKLYEKELLEIKQLPLDQRMRMVASHGGESSFDIAHRVLPVLKKGAAQYPDSTILFVCHGWVIRSLLIVLFAIEDHRISVENGGYILLEDKNTAFHLIEHEGVKIETLHPSIF